MTVQRHVCNLWNKGTVTRTWVVAGCREQLVARQICRQPPEDMKAALVTCPDYKLHLVALLRRGAEPRQERHCVRWLQTHMRLAGPAAGPSRHTRARLPRWFADETERTCPGKHQRAGA